MPAARTRLAMQVETEIRSAKATQPPDGAPGALGDHRQTALLAWELAGRRALVALSSPSERSAVALDAAARVGGPVVVLAPTAARLEHWRTVMSEHAGPTTLLTLEAVRSRLTELPPRGLLVVDDATALTGDDRGLALGATPCRLGLAAAVPRDPRRRQLLGDLVGPVALEHAEHAPRGRLFGAVDVVIVGLLLTPEERSAYEADAALYDAVVGDFFRTSSSASWRDFARSAAGSPAATRAMATWVRMRRLVRYPRAKGELVAALLQRHRGARILVFTPDNETAYAIARQELVMPVTSELGQAERGAAIEAFRDGRLRVLAGSQLLADRVGGGEADVAIIVGGSRGSGEHERRVSLLLEGAAGRRTVLYELVTQFTLEARQAWRRRQGLGIGAEI